MDSQCSCVYVYYFVVLEVGILYLGEVVAPLTACLFSLPLLKDLAMNICHYERKTTMCLEHSGLKLLMKVIIYNICFLFLW